MLLFMSTKWGFCVCIAKPRAVASFWLCIRRLFVLSSLLEVFILLLLSEGRGRLYLMICATL